MYTTTKATFPKIKLRWPSAPCHRCSSLLVLREQDMWSEPLCCLRISVMKSDANHQLTSAVLTPASSRSRPTAAVWHTDRYKAERQNVNDVEIQSAGRAQQQLCAPIKIHNTFFMFGTNYDHRRYLSPLDDQVLDQAAECLEQSAWRGLVLSNFWA